MNRTAIGLEVPGPRIARPQGIGIGDAVGEPIEIDLQPYLTTALTTQQSGTDSNEVDKFEVTLLRRHGARR